jgi:hypothetical protein
MLVPSVVRESDDDFHGTSAQGFGLLETVGGLEQGGQGQKRRCDIGVLGTIALLVDGERPAHQGLGRFKAVGGLEQPGQVVEGDCDIGVLGTIALLIDFEGSAYEGFGLLEAVGGLEQQRVSD